MKFIYVTFDNLCVINSFDIIHEIGCDSARQHGVIWACSCGNML